MNSISLFLFVVLIFISFSSLAKESCNDDFVEGKNGWIFRDKTDFQETFEINGNLQNYIQKFNETLQRQNITLVISLLPTRGMMHSEYYSEDGFSVETAQRNYLQTAEILRDLGMQVASVDNFENSLSYFYKTDHHWTRAGAELMAKNTAKIIKSLPIYPKIKKKEFKTEQNEEEKFEGSFVKSTNIECYNNVSPSEVVSIYKTFPVLKGDLLNNVEQPEIVLIGTSNSDNKASKANFEGFLKENLSTDIINHSVSGGGHDSAMLKYLNSKEFREYKPKIIIWEFPIYQNFRDADFYKQIIPSALGACDNNTIWEKELEIKGDKARFDIPHEINVENTYMYLNIPNFNQRKLRLTRVYDDTRVPFDFKRSKYYGSGENFFLLPEHKTGLKAVEILLPSDKFNRATLQFCPYSE